MPIAAPALLAAQLSMPPAIDVYTMGQGSDLFERFGHAAICVVDTRHPARTLCYNYGTTDFGSPPEELGWRFLRGTAMFWVSVWPLDRMLRVYRAHDRTVWRQRLVLSPDAARRVAAHLARDALPENRYYRYHHFYDNCSTRVRDVIDDATDGKLSGDGDESLSVTFRQLGRQRLAGERAPLLLGDLLVGRNADLVVDVHDGMFLPSLLREQVTRRFGVEPEVVYRRRGPAFPQDPGSNVATIAAVGAGLAALLALPKGRRVVRGLVGAVLGVLSLVVWAVVAASTVPELRMNELVLVLWPTDLALGFLSAERGQRYARVRVAGLALCALLAAVGVLRQPVLPFVVLAALPFALLAFSAQAWRASSTTDATA